MLKSPSAKAGDSSSIPGPGRSRVSCSNKAHVPQLLTLGATTPEPTGWNYWSPYAQSLCSARREVTAVRSPHTTTKSRPCLLQLEKSPWEWREEEWGGNRRGFRRKSGGKWERKREIERGTSKGVGWSTDEYLLLIGRHKVPPSCRKRRNRPYISVSRRGKN